MEHEARQIVVDADACPVKREIITVARAYQVPVLMVASHDHRLAPESGVVIKQIDPSDQAVDLYIANHLRAGDLLITQDFGLAALGLGQKAQVLSFRGQAYTQENIDFLLARRHELTRQRRGGIRSKGPRAMKMDDRENFLQSLTKVLEMWQENGAC